MLCLLPNVRSMLTQEYPLAEVVVAGLYVSDWTDADDRVDVMSVVGVPPTGDTTPAVVEDGGRGV